MKFNKHLNPILQWLLFTLGAIVLAISFRVLVFGVFTIPTPSIEPALLGGLLVVAIAAVAAFNVNMNTEKSELSLLALANVEALAGESFTWGGTKYTNEFQHYNTIPFTSNWKPILTECSTSWTSPGSIYTITTQGKRVVCNNGEGNCKMAGDCTQS